MLQDPALLLVSPIVGLALGAAAALARARVARWIDVAVVTVFAIVPLAVAERTVLEQSSPGSLWEWSAVGGAAVQAAYHVDPLAVTASSVVAIATGVTLHAIARRPSAPPLLLALVAAQGIGLVALVAMTDLVAGTLVAGSVGLLAVAVGLFVASAEAAARLAALIALGIESFIAAALLLARVGVASFDLASLPPMAIEPGVVAATTLGAALFCGLYPFVPWRYEAAAAPDGGTLAPLRGAALFATGVAGSVLAIRLVAATGVPTTALALPDVPALALGLALLVVVVLTALAVLDADRAARLRRAVTGSIFLVFVAALPALHWSHIVGLLALLTVMYATVASAAHVDEWRVARFDVRLATLWAAVASGSPLALAGALFGLVASSVALVVELAPARGAAGDAARLTARVLVVLGPFLALVGAAFSDDPAAGALAAVVLGWAGLLGLGHAVRDDALVVTRPRVRVASALVAIAATVALADVAYAPAVAASRLLPATVTPPLDLALGAMAALVVALAVVIAALPGLAARAHLGPRVVDLLRRVLAATDPSPALALAYRALEEWSRRIGGGFATFEDRAGVWLATLLLALTLLWAATS